MVVPNTAGTSAEARPCHLARLGSAGAWDSASALAMHSFQLEFVNTAMRGKTIPVKDGLLIGSGPECRIRAAHPDLHPAHARFLLGTNLVVETAAPGASIDVNGRAVVRAELRHRDEIVIGPLRLRVLEGVTGAHTISGSRIPARTSGVMHLDQLLSEAGIKPEAQEIFDFAKEDLFYRSGKEPALRERIAFIIPSRDKYIDQAQVFLTRLVKGSGADEVQIDNFMTCAKELVLNAHRHGHQYDEAKRIIIRYRDDGECLSLVIEDEGPGFDHRAAMSSAQAKDAATAARERYLAGGFGGLGFQLITKLSKTLVYNDKGNVVTFTVSKKEEEPEG